MPVLRGGWRQLEDGTGRVLARDQRTFLSCGACGTPITADGFKEVADAVLCANCARPLPTPEDLKAAAARAEEQKKYRAERRDFYVKEGIEVPPEVRELRPLRWDPHRGVTGDDRRAAEPEPQKPTTSNGNWPR